MTTRSESFQSNLASSLICVLSTLARNLNAEQLMLFPGPSGSWMTVASVFVAGRAAIRSSQVVIHHFPQPERQIRHAMHRRDHLQDRQLRDRGQSVRCQ
jgi:hypothetical protein